MVTLDETIPIFFSHSKSHKQRELLHALSFSICIFFFASFQIPFVLFNVCVGLTKKLLYCCTELSFLQTDQMVVIVVIAELCRLYWITVYSTWLVLCPVSLLQTD